MNMKWFGAFLVVVAVIAGVTALRKMPANIKTARSQAEIVAENRRQQIAADSAEFQKRVESAKRLTGDPCSPEIMMILISPSVNPAFQQNELVVLGSLVAMFDGETLRQEPRKDGGMDYHWWNGAQNGIGGYAGKKFSPNNPACKHPEAK